MFLREHCINPLRESQSLFYWITYSYDVKNGGKVITPAGLNPYFIGLPILIGIPPPMITGL